MSDNSVLDKYSVIHITGAAGSGTTTLARAMARKYGHTHLDTDDYFWEKTDPPFAMKREYALRQKLLGEAIGSCEKCVISGSLTEWGDIFIPLFKLVIYVYTPTEVRLERLRKREFEWFGSRILPGGDMAAEQERFLLWAAEYDDGGMDIRSARHHAEWLKMVDCPVVRLDGMLPVEENMAILEKVSG